MRPCTRWDSTVLRRADCQAFCRRFIRSCDTERGAREKIIYTNRKKGEKFEWELSFVFIFFFRFKRIFKNKLKPPWPSRFPKISQTKLLMQFFFEIRNLACFVFLVRICLNMINQHIFVFFFFVIWQFGVLSRSTRSTLRLQQTPRCHPPVRLR